MTVSRIEWAVRTESDRLLVSEADAGSASSDSDEIVWFESGDVALRSSGEAMATASLISALHTGLRLQVELPVDAVWLENCSRVLELLHGWWDYPILVPIVRATRRRDTPPGSLTGLCFSGGVDSFHSLLSLGMAVDVLVFAHGFDIKIDAAGEVETYLPALAAIAKATGTRVILVRTNLRQTASLGSTTWERTHGSAMATVGHLLAGSIGRLAISSMDYLGHERPWGSHWRLDPLWSAGNMDVIHVGAEASRVEKLAAIARHPLVRKYLRVCWEHLGPGLNCGRCEKCLRTQVMLATVGALEGVEAFDSRIPLADRIDQLTAMRPNEIDYWDFAMRGLPPALHTAVQRLLTRSRATAGQHAARHAPP